MLFDDDAWQIYIVGYRKISKEETVKWKKNIDVITPVT